MSQTRKRYADVKRIVLRELNTISASDRVRVIHVDPRDASAARQVVKAIEGDGFTASESKDGDGIRIRIEWAGPT